ncbi:PLP-dependent cysteine synthase family protein [Aspergillus stella-maris]|uniref:PLP-dependent cysteine synthase family protein n=1 Tax=Aspergillus stella-maris TaxID=1810926 RepID=UPI003CCD0EC0
MAAPATAPAPSILATIGNTPVLHFRNITPPDHANVYLKLESLNPTGSYKDRMALSMITQAEKRGDLKPGMTVVEATGGSTGSSLAFICAVKGYNFHVVSSDVFAAEKIKTMRAFGAEVDLMHVPGGKITKELFPEMMERATVKVESDPGRELVEQFAGGIDAFCGAAGSAGMLMGVATILKKQNQTTSKDTKVVVLEPASSPVITQGWTGTHGVEGISPGFRPPHLDDALCDEARAIDEEEGRAMCRRLAREEGVLVGTSAGLNVGAALQLAKELGPGKTVVTVACDTGLKYMNSSLLADS